MIPKLLHQIWLGPREIPQHFVDWRNNFYKLHPDWDYRLWTDADVETLPNEVKSIVNSLTCFASKSNIVRLYAVWRYGGVYADMDID